MHYLHVHEVRILLEKMIVAQLAKKSPTLCGAQRFTIIFIATDSYKSTATEPVSLIP
jgi:hypothetical protein